MIRAGRVVVSGGAGACHQSALPANETSSHRVSRRFTNLKFLSRGLGHGAPLLALLALFWLDCGRAADEGRDEVLADRDDKVAVAQGVTRDSAVLLAFQRGRELLSQGRDEQVVGYLLPVLEDILLNEPKADEEKECDEKKQEND